MLRPTFRYQEPIITTVLRFLDGHFRLAALLAAWSLAAAPLTSHAIDPTSRLSGEWLCTTHAAPTTAPQRHYVSIANGVLQTDTLDTDMQLTPADAAGTTHYRGQWVNAAPTAATTERQLQLVTPDTLHYSDIALPQATKLDAGTCQRLPAPTTAALPRPAAGWMFTPLAAARPTQPAVGYDQIYAKQARYRDHQAGRDGWKKAWDDWCQISGLGGVRKKTVTATSRLTDPQSFSCKQKAADRDIQALKTAVVGPGGQLYMTDGHHSLSSLWEAPLRAGDDHFGKAGGALAIPVRIQADYQHLNNASFWRTMRAQGYTWLQRPDGSPITPAQLPPHMGLSHGLQDDPYRSLVYFTRDVGHQMPDDAPEFAEFYWSAWLRAAPRHLDLSRYQLDQLGAGDGSDHGYLQAVHDAAALMVQAPATEVVGPEGATAARMGQLPRMDAAALQALATKSGLPGKLAAAVDYRHRHRQR